MHHSNHILLHQYVLHGSLHPFPLTLCTSRGCCYIKIMSYLSCSQYINDCPLPWIKVLTMTYKALLDLAFLPLWLSFLSCPTLCHQHWPLVLLKTCQTCSFLSYFLNTTPPIWIALPPPGNVVHSFVSFKWHLSVVSYIWATTICNMELSTLTFSFILFYFSL